MKPLLPSLLPLFLAICMAYPGIAHAWDATGHMLVDEIAYENTKPEVRAKVNALLRKLDTRYNNHTPYNFITAGCYMDDTRPTPGYAYSTWHYINVEYTPDGSGYAEPAPPHVLWAIEQAARKLLAREGVSDEEKAVALAMVMHFTGDVHQPLHCTDWHDQGGGGYYVMGMPTTDISKKQVPTLHFFWDRAYRYEAKDNQIVELFFGLWTSERPIAPPSGVIKNQAAKIMMDYPASQLADLIKVDDPHDWARESYAIGCKSAYPPGPHPGDNEVVKLTPAFAHQAHEIARKRIALAGYRLAELLNTIFNDAPAQ